MPLCYPLVEARYPKFSNTLSHDFTYTDQEASDNIKAGLKDLVYQP